jgi:hypothetical protein
MLTTKLCKLCNQEKWFNPEATGYGTGCLKGSNFTGNTCRDCVLARAKTYYTRRKTTPPLNVIDRNK